MEDVYAGFGATEAGRIDHGHDRTALPLHAVPLSTMLILFCLVGLNLF